MVDGKILFIRTLGKSHDSQTQFKPRDKKMKDYNKWEDFADVWRKKAPPSMATLIHLSDSWVNMPTEIAFVENAVSGIIISVLFAFLILIVHTNNYIISLLAIFSVLTVVISVVAIMQLNGY